MRTYAPNGTKNVASGENRETGSRTAYMDGWAESGWGFSLHSMRVYSRFLSQYLNYYFRKRAICATRFLRIRFILFSPTYFSHPANVFCVFAYECGSTTMEISIFFFCHSQLPTLRLRVEKSVVMLKYYTWTRRNQSFLAKTTNIFPGMTID